MPTLVPERSFTRLAELHSALDSSLFATGLSVPYGGSQLTATAVYFADIGTDPRAKRTLPRSSQLA